MQDGLLYRRWQAPGGHRDILQLLVPYCLRSRVLPLVHGSVGFTSTGQAAFPHQSAATTSECPVSEMFCCFGAPEELHSDQERNFEAGVFSEACRPA